jgi:phthiocerol/phenolphthiocerol synthesis type-I polyketide synthase E
MAKSTIRSGLTRNLKWYIDCKSYRLAALPRARRRSIEGISIMNPNVERPTALSATQVATPLGDIEGQLTRIWQELLGVEPIAPDQNYFDLGGDSSLAVHLFVQIEKTFNVKLPIFTLFEAPTIGELAQVLRRDVAPAGWSPLVAIQPNGSRPPFFCMHGAGGNVLIYRELSKLLGNDQPFYGLQSQGLDGDVPPLTKIEDMASLYVKEIRRARPSGPYLIGGYCMGGTIAYEVAQQLRSQGQDVALLALFDTMNWSKIPLLNVWNKSFMACEKFMFHASNFFRLDSAGRSEFFAEKVQALRNRIPVWKGMLQAKFEKAESGAESGSMALGQIWKANDLACVAYIPKPYPGVVTDVRPMKQYGLFDRPDAKWDQLAEGGQNIIVLPVYPAGMLVEPFVRHLGSAVSKSIDAALRP